MSREIDTRDFTTSRVTPNRTQQLHAAAANISDRLAGAHRVRITQFNAVTGNPSAVVSDNAATQVGDYVRRALEHVQVIGPALGLAAQPAEFLADPQVQKTNSDARAVNLQQRYKGIPIFQAAVTVRFDPKGTLTDTVGDTVSVGPDLPVAPQLSVQQAVLKAAEHVATPPPDEQGVKDQFGESLMPPQVSITGFSPKIRVALTEIPERTTVLEPGPFGADIKASLVWFPRDNQLLLAWDTLLTMPDYAGQYQTIVDANSGEILYCRQLIQTVHAVGNVYRVDGGSARQMTDFPRSLGEYGLMVPSVGQNNWRWCHKCQGLYFAGSATQGSCPAGGTHDHTGSGDYRLVNNSPGAPGQNNWRWCHKCQGLYFAGSASQGTCPAGGTHDHTGSGDYRLVNNAFWAPGQSNWQWCNKCQGLSFAGNATQGACPAGGVHNHAGSGNYTLQHNPAALPSGFPDDWVTSNSTVGNPVNAHLGDAGAPITGAVQNGVLTFNPAAAIGDDQKVLNIFYYNGCMHDVFYLLGFTELAGNFQQNDFGRGGVQSDSVDARSYPGAVFGTANMGTPVDGSSPTMRMGMVTSTNRHTAFDSTVVFHEFMHGVTNRLVGGPMNVNALSAPQSGGMGEGWGDYVACSLNNVTVLGNWILNNTAGIRAFPYDSNFPDHFGKLGTGRYNEVHNNGEIWCATLMEMNRRTDKSLAMQLVVDALKLSPANPSFLQMRDAIVLALDHMLTAGRINGPQRDAAWQGIWGAFAKFGMGPQAASNGAQLNGIVADFTVGQDNWRWCHKCQGMYFAGNPTQGACPAGGAHDHTGSGNYDIVNNWPAAPGQNNWRWCHKCQGMYFAGNPTQGACPAGGAHDHTGSGDYKLIQNIGGGTGQHGWRWCHKCEGLYFAGNPTQGVCKAGGSHDHTGSGDYSLMSH